MSKLFTTFVLTTGVLFFLSSCTKKNTFVPTQRAAVIFHMHHYINDTHVGANTVAFDDSGRRYQLSVARFYISQITFHNADGTDWQSYGKHSLISLGQEEYLIDSVPVGNYKSISFVIGLDPTTNKTSPDQYETGDVLGYQTPSMYFGDGKGYIFMNVQGKADTSAAQNAAVNVGFNFQVGTDNLSRTVNMSAHSFSLVAYQSQILDIKVDYSVFLQSLDFKTQTYCTPFTDGVMATMFANREMKMFSWGL
ncbi:MAG: hypothetical protein JSS82_00550 [Bacteroidetes bacterium]|nr:hypothetical protein [Bacteroidota bacterium]